MRIVDHTTGWSLHRVGSEEEAQLALARIVNERLRRSAARLWVCGWSNGQPGALGRTVGDVAAATEVLGGALRPPDGDPIGRRTWCVEDLVVAPFTVHNTADWPVTVAELRLDSSLAEVEVAALAVHLNGRFAGDVAAVLTVCADYRAAADGETLWDRIRDGGDLWGATVANVAEAVRCGGRCWTALCAWTPGGGADGDPYLVARYAWGPLRAAVKLDSHELLERHLAGDVELVLYRTVIDAGAGRTEYIWAQQNFRCCDRDWPLAGGDRVPIWTVPWNRHQPGWNTPRARLWSRAMQCMICGAVSVPSWLTRRHVGEDSGPLGAIEPIDALPTATLTAAAAGGLRAITSNPTPGDER